jgi:hypothetical protein
MTAPQDIVDEHRLVIQEWLERFECFDDEIGDALHDLKHDEHLLDDLPAAIRRDVEKAAVCLRRVRYWLADLRHKLAD